MLIRFSSPSIYVVCVASIFTIYLCAFFCICVCVAKNSQVVARILDVTRFTLIIMEKKKCNTLFVRFKFERAVTNFYKSYQFRMSYFFSYYSSYFLNDFAKSSSSFGIFLSTGAARVNCCFHIGRSKINNFDLLTSFLWRKIKVYLKL